LAAYEALRQRLGRELGADPAPQTRELHLAILREQDGGLALRACLRTCLP
jgi:DNA-binding SARP family transcriptional activator